MKARSFLLSLFLATNIASANDQITDQVVEQAHALINKVTAPLPNITEREIHCMARNIYHESGSESIEGKVAVGMVTINRANDPRFPSDVCNVVNQRTNLVRTRTVVKETRGFFGRVHTEAFEQQFSISVCQFSWACKKPAAPKAGDPRWVESLRVAKALVAGGFAELQDKYSEVLFFHAIYVRPNWKNLQKVARVGGHVFYK